MANPFLRKLRKGASLSADDERTLLGLCQSVQQVGPRLDILHEDDCPRHLTLILQGWACRYKILENGRRQIIALFLPGDLCEPFGILPRFMSYGVGTLTAVTFARVHPEEIKAAAQTSAPIDRALWWDALVAMAMQDERAVSLGRRHAVERTAHLICELQVRLETVGLADRTGFEFPLTQAEMGDALGISTVHINRSLQELRASGLITLRSRQMRIHDLRALQDIALFDYAFMHMTNKVAR